MPDGKQKKGSRKLTPDEAHLQERLNIPGLGPFETVNPNLPPIERAPGFRPETKLIGFGQPEALELERLYQLAPQLRGRADTITHGVGPMYMTKFANAPGSEKFIEDISKPINLMGLAGTGKNRHKIEIYPTDIPSNFVGTLAHELAHVNATREEDKIRGLGLGVDALTNSPVQQVQKDTGDFGAYKTGSLARRIFYPPTNGDENLYAEVGKRGITIQDAERYAAARRKK